MKIRVIYICSFFLAIALLNFILIIGMSNCEEIIYTNCTEKLFDGCWADVKENILSEEGKVIATVDRENWVCVNIKGMDYERAVEVCKHEVGHEIFAEACENNMTKCLEVMK